jgi:hypothetical protein
MPPKKRPLFTDDLARIWCTVFKICIIRICELEVDHPRCFFGCCFTSSVIAGGGIDRSMTDKWLNGWEIRASINETADVETAEIVGTEILELCTFSQSFKNFK